MPTRSTLRHRPADPAWAPPALREPTGSVLLPRPADAAWAPQALLDLVGAVADDPRSWRSAVRFDAGRRHWSRLPAPDGVHLERGVVHDVGNRGTAPAVSVHAYSPPLSSMSFYESSPSGLHRVRTVVTDQPEQA